MHIEMPEIVKIIMIRVMSARIDLVVPPSTSVIGCYGSNVKIHSSSVICGWVASVL